jgi:hypothetical protein
VKDVYQSGEIETRRYPPKDTSVRRSGPPGDTRAMPVLPWIKRPLPAHRWEHYGVSTRILHAERNPFGTPAHVDHIEQGSSIVVIFGAMILVAARTTERLGRPRSRRAGRRAIARQASRSRIGDATEVAVFELVAVAEGVPSSALRPSSCTSRSLSRQIPDPDRRKCFRHLIQLGPTNVIENSLRLR